MRYALALLGLALAGCVTTQQRLDEANAKIVELHQRMADMAAQFRRQADAALKAQDDADAADAGALNDCQSRLAQAVAQQSSDAAAIHAAEGRAQEAQSLLEARANACVESIPAAVRALHCVPEGDARTAAACAASRVCADEARCGHVDGIGCVPTRDAHCRASKFCTLLGLCSKAVGHYTCVAMKEADCRASIACRFEGRCSLTSALDCQ